MAGLIPAIHVLLGILKTWMRGKSSPKTRFALSPDEMIGSSAFDRSDRPARRVTRTRKIRRRVWPHEKPPRGLLDGSRAATKGEETFSITLACRLLYEEHEDE